MSNAIIKVTPAPPQQLCPDKIELPKRKISDAMREALKNVGRYIEWENGMEEYRGVPCYSYHRIIKVMADQYETRYITDDICPLANSKNIRRIVDAPPEV